MAEPSNTRGVVIVGGGFAGVTLAGALNDLLSHARKLYPKVAECGCTVTVLEAMDRLMGEFPEGLAEFARRQMERRGIEPTHLKGEPDGLDP